MRSLRVNSQLPTKEQNSPPQPIYKLDSRQGRGLSTAYVPVGTESPDPRPQDPTGRQGAPGPDRPDIDLTAILLAERDAVPLQSHLLVLSRE